MGPRFRGDDEVKWDSASHSAVIARLDRATQYAAALGLIARPLEYWVPAFAGTTVCILEN